MTLITSGIIFHMQRLKQWTCRLTLYCPFRKFSPCLDFLCLIYLLKSTSSHRGFFTQWLWRVGWIGLSTFLKIYSIKTAAELNLERAWARLLPLPAVLFTGTKHVWDWKEFTGSPKGSEILGDGVAEKCRCLEHLSMMNVHQKKKKKTKGKGTPRDVTAVFACSTFQTCGCVMVTSFWAFWD